MRLLKYFFNLISTPLYPVSKVRSSVCRGFLRSTVSWTQFSSTGKYLGVDEFVCSISSTMRNIYLVRHNPLDVHQWNASTLGGCGIGMHRRAQGWTGVDRGAQGWTGVHRGGQGWTRLDRGGKEWTGVHRGGPGSRSFLVNLSQYFLFSNLPQAQREQRRFEYSKVAELKKYCSLIKLKSTCLSHGFLWKTVNREQMF